MSGRDRQLWAIGLEHLPVENMNTLADLLDPQNGPISMETFAQSVDSLHGYRLGLNSQLLTAIRHRCGQQRPTIVLLMEYLRPHGVTVGEIIHVLDNMRAATRNIFDITGILRMHNASLSLPSGSTPSQHRCHCSECNIGVPDQRLNATQQLPGSPTRVYQPHPIHRSMEPVRRFESRIPHFSASGSQVVPCSRPQNWYPPECDCGLSSCPECERKRLSDPDETILLSVDEQSARVRLNHLNQPASRVSNRIPDEHRNIDGDELLHEVSYTENLTNSVDLRGSPEGTSNLNFPSTNQSMSKNMHDQNQDANIKAQCTCRKSILSACTCKHITRLQSQQSQQCISLKNGDKSNRWSTESAPLIGQNSSEEIIYHRSGDSNYSQDTMYSRQSIKSSSDRDISYPSNNSPKDQQSGNMVLISYTDDVKNEVIHLAQNLKGGGFQVSTDMHENSYFKAKNKGLVTEQDQYLWLRNKYCQAKYIIVCLSKGYFECLNVCRNSACPSAQYLNARYIYDLIDNDPRKNETVIEVTFRNSFPNASSYFQYAKRFNIPCQMQALKLYLGN